MSKKKFTVIVADCPWPFHDSLKMSDVKRGAEANYHTMTMQEIRELPIESICNPSGAVLCLWVPGSLLQDGLDTMKAWGFEHKQTYVWVKTKKNPFKEDYQQLKKRGFDQIKYLFDHQVDPKELSARIKEVAISIAGKLGFLDLNDSLAFGMGRLFRQTHEICLIGTKGKIYDKLKNKSQRSVSFGENLRHSAKPEHLQDSLEAMFPKTRKLELFARRIRPGWTCLGNEIDGKDIRDALSEL